jgi:LEA14-like dessication related protein
MVVRCISDFASCYSVASLRLQGGSRLSNPKLTRGNLVFSFRMRRKFLVLMLVTGVLASACARAPVSMEPPQVTLAGISLVGLDLLEQRYELRLRVQNPNDFDFIIEGMQYQVEINDKLFARGNSNHVVSVPHNDMRTISVDAVSTLNDVLRQLQVDERSGPEVLRYRVSGTLTLRHHGSDIAFDHRGEIRLPAG